jgi:hypothetical protein
MEAKRKRGRPTGSKNKPKQEIVRPEMVITIPDKFIDEDTNLPEDLHASAEYTEHDLKEELCHLEGFHDYMEENRNSLTFGDY